jgi:flagellin-like protein
MQLEQLLVNERVVSSVIGVVLMVAVTVILASVIAVSVFGTFDTSESPPRTTFTFEYDEQTEKIEVLVVGGDQFDAEQVTFEGAGFGANETGESWASIVRSNPGSTGTTTQVTGGDTVTLTQADSDYLLEVVWTAPDSQSSSVIGSRAGPDR